MHKFFTYLTFISFLSTQSVLSMWQRPAAKILRNEIAKAFDINKVGNNAIDVLANFNKEYRNTLLQQSLTRGLFPCLGAGFMGYLAYKDASMYRYYNFDEKRLFYSSVFILTALTALYSIKKVNDARVRHWMYKQLKQNNLNHYNKIDITNITRQDISKRLRYTNINIDPKDAVTPHATIIHQPQESFWKSTPKNIISEKTTWNIHNPRT